MNEQPQDPTPSPSPPPAPPSPITIVEKPGTARGNRINVTVIKPPRRNPRAVRRR